MPAASKSDLLNPLEGSVSLDNGSTKIEDADKFRTTVLDNLLQEAVLNENKEIKQNPAAQINRV